MIESVWWWSLIPIETLKIAVIGAVVAGLALIAAASIISSIPFIKKYSLAGQLAGLGIVMTGMFYHGVLSNELAWKGRVEAAEAQVKQLEEQVKIAEAKSQQVNEIIKTEVVVQTKVIHDTKRVIQEKIKLVEVEIDRECRVVPEVVDIHNQAAARPARADSAKNKVEKSRSQPAKPEEEEVAVNMYSSPIVETVYSEDSFVDADGGQSVEVNVVADSGRVEVVELNVQERSS